MGDNENFCHSDPSSNDTIIVLKSNKFTNSVSSMDESIGG